MESVTKTQRHVVLDVRVNKKVGKQEQVLIPAKLLVSIYWYFPLFSQRAAGLPPTTKRPADICRGEFRLPVCRIRPGGFGAPLPAGGGPEGGCPLPCRPPHLEGPIAS